MTTAPAPPTGTPRTRDELLALGKTGDSWAFVPLAASCLAQAPDDHALRWLLALHLARLGLGTPAREQVALCSEEVRALPQVALVAQLAEAAGEGVLDAERVLARVPHVLERLEERTARALSAGMEGLRRVLETHEVLIPRISGEQVGMIVRERGSADIRGWRGVYDAKALGMAWGRARTTGDALGAPMVIVGLRNALPALRAARALPMVTGKTWPAVWIIESSPTDALLGLCTLDEPEALLQPAVRLLVGSDSGERSIREWRDRDDQLPRTLVALPEPEQIRTSETLGPQVQALHDVQAREVATLLDRTKGIYAGRDASWWAARHGEAFAEGSPRPLRLVLVTTRYSTFVRHSCEDLAQSARAMGFEAHVLIEPEEGSLLSPLSYLRAFDRVRPDVVVMINYTRAIAQRLMPRELPVLTWVQDAMPHLLSREMAAQQGELDVLVGCRMPELVRVHGYDERRVLPAPVPVNPRKFSRVERQRGGPDVALVTHHAPSPRELHAQIMAQQTDSQMATMLDSLYESCVALGTQQRWGLKQELSSLASGALAVTFGREPDAGEVSRLLHGYCLRIADRAVRHQTLEWTLEACEREGLSLALVGNDWDKSPRFARSARPAIEHGTALRDFYASAGCCVHVSLHGVLHQRVFECAMSGGLPVCRATINAAWPAFARARALVAAALDGTPQHAPGVWRVLPEAWPALDRAISLLATWGVARERVVDGHGRVEILESHAVGGDVDEVASGIIEPASAAFFLDGAGLGRLLVRATRDPAWREATSTAIARACEDHVTTDALLARALALLARAAEERALAEAATV